MDKEEIKLSFDSEKMEALVFYLKKESTNVQSRMDDALRQLYEQAVPEPVREYLDAKAAPAARSKRPPRPSRPKAAVPKPGPAATSQELEDSV